MGSCSQFWYPNNWLMPRKLFDLIHTENTFQIYWGCTKSWDPGLIDITFYMLNLACTLNSKSSYRYDPHHAKDCESSPHGYISQGQCWGCIYLIGPQQQQLPRYTPDANFTQPVDCPVELSLHNGVKLIKPIKPVACETDDWCYSLNQEVVTWQ